MSWRLIEECIRVKEAYIDGMWLMPRLITDSEYVWDGVFFCRKGPLAPSVVRFSIDNSNDNLILFNGASIPIPHSLLEEPLELQLWIKTLIDEGKVQYDPLHTLTYEYLFGASASSSSIEFKDTKSLAELDALLSN